MTPKQFILKSPWIVWKEVARQAGIPYATLYSMLKDPNREGFSRKRKERQLVEVLKGMGYEPPKRDPEVKL